MTMPGGSRRCYRINFCRGSQGGPGAANVSFAFEPKALAKPQILTSAENPAAGESLVLNGTEFDAGKLRVFIKDVGASVGDEVVLTTKIGGVAQTIDKKTIPASGQAQIQLFRLLTLILRILSQRV